MTVVIDTNVVFQGRGIGHPYHCILDACVDGKIVWAVSNAILKEYEEVIRRKEPESCWHDLGLLMDYITLTQGTMLHVSPQFRFRIIHADPDDNPFVDCAIAGHADYIITDDRHFAPLAGAGYKPQPIKPLDFIAKYRGIYV
ncbi:MAG TPA: putative toxin-antitoxin system toxin component, PIN family [Verrucomicrobiales bacterium]|nr:putative toxin-antitoxin system toxin component, PIN family [Verrucomicrobiales bacterium]